MQVSKTKTTPQSKFVATVAFCLGTICSAPSHAASWSTQLWIPKIVATGSSALGLDGIHNVVHQQQLVLFKPWATGVSCGGAAVPVTLTWYDDNGNVVGSSGTESVVPCGRTIIPAVDQKYSAPEGSHLRLSASSAIVATWTLAPQYEWQVPILLAQGGLDGVNPYVRWVFSDVSYLNNSASGGTSNGSTPPYANTYSFSAVQIVNPQSFAVTVDVVLVSDSGATNDTAYTIPAHGAKSIRLDSTLPSFTGQVIVQAQGNNKILVWGSWFQYPATNSAPPPALRQLDPIAFNP